MTGMKRREALAAAAAWAAGAAGFGLPAAVQAQAPAQAPAGPRRIITVTGAFTEIVYALGAQGQLVGTDTTSLWPEAARHTAKVGYMRQLSAEGLLSLRPTHVLGTHEAGPAVVLDQVRSAGVQVDLVQADHRFEEVLRKIEVAGRACAREADAARLSAQVREGWQAAQAAVEKRAKLPGARPPRVLFVLAHGGAPQVAGRETAASAMIAYAGATNALPGFAGYRPLTAEALASAAPDVVLTTTLALEGAGGEAGFWANPGWALTPAGRARRLVSMDPLYLLGFGPRMPQAVGELAGRLAG